ncbi:hypothetical protein [Streptosporangium fragile]|uniref:hypothetical protein n=1 Tax=Streptosporangium fragile TaxID=46186 RepID=UPI0031F0F721
MAFAVSAVFVVSAVFAAGAADFALRAVDRAARGADPAFRAVDVPDVPDVSDVVGAGDAFFRGAGPGSRAAGSADRLSLRARWAITVPTPMAAATGHSMSPATARAPSPP